MRAFRALPTLLLSTVFACSPRPNEPRTAGATPESCEQQRQELIALLEHLPERAVAGAVHVELPKATLGGNVGTGAVLEVDARAAWLDGEPLVGESHAARAVRLEGSLAEALDEHAGHARAPQSSTEPGHRPTLYIAGAAGLDVQTLRTYLRAVPETVALRLLFDAPTLPVSSDTERGGRDLATRLLGERDPSKRREIARRGYETFAECSNVHEAVRAADSVAEDDRWPLLRTRLLEATRVCSCESLDSGSLKHLVAAEQRAGAMAFGSLPLSFLRDERCGASMPLRSLQKLLTQVEAFDAEFAGDWQHDALAFDRVVTDERLLGYFCDALPGETLAALQRARASVYWRTVAGMPCEAWQFEPLAPGTPMGTWRRRASSSSPPLSLHYWQGSEEIRVYGPQLQNSKPTDEKPWECNQNLKMTGVDASGITLEAGRWYFTESACNAANASEGLVPGCVGRLVAGNTSAPEAAPSEAKSLKQGEPTEGSDAPAGVDF